MKYLLFTLVLSSSQIAMANGYSGYGCSNTMFGQYSPEMERGAQRSRDEFRAREEQAFKDLMAPFVGHSISLKDISRLHSSGLVLDVGQGRVSYAVETSGQTIYPVIIKVSNDSSYTQWMTLEELKQRIR